MKSLLNIEETAARYGLNEDLELKEELIALDNFIWQNCEINTVDDLVAFEKQYQELGKNLDFCYDSEVEEFSPVYMCDGEMCLLEQGAFQRTAKGNGELFQMFVAAGLSDLEAVVVITFLVEISGLYRKDAYHHGVPPFVKAVCEILNSGISKLPAYSGTVVRACNDYDKADFRIGDIFTPGYCLTCSADYENWKDGSRNRYVITTLDSEHTKARNLFCIHDISEQQVTFLQNARFRITSVSDRGEGKKQVEMQEI